MTFLYHAKLREELRLALNISHETISSGVWVNISVAVAVLKK